MRRLGKILPALLLAAAMAFSLLPWGFCMTEQEIQEEVDRWTVKETSPGDTIIQIWEVTKKPDVPDDWYTLIIAVRDEATKHPVSDATVRLYREELDGQGNIVWKLYASGKTNGAHSTDKDGKIGFYVHLDHTGDQVQHFRVVIQHNGYVDYHSIGFHVMKNGQEELVELVKKDPVTPIDPEPTPTPWWPWWPWPTPTPTPTPTPRPTPTPGPTATPTPSASPSPSPTPSQTPEPSASPDPAQTGSPEPQPIDPSPTPTGGREPGGPNQGGNRPGPGGIVPKPSDPGGESTSTPDPAPTETVEVLPPDPTIQLPVDPGGNIDELRPLPADSHTCGLHWPIIPCIVVTLIGGITRLLILWRKEREYQRRKAEELERMGSV